VVHILAIEDSSKILAVIEQCLSEHGCQVRATTRGEEGGTLAATETFDAIMLDLMLPDCDGVELCRQLRRNGVQTPILVVSARDDAADKVEGLNAGADDYLAKPFACEELIARLHALVRRAGAGGATSKLSCDGLELDLIRRTCQREGQRIELTPREFALLEFFLRHPGQMLDRQTISEQVWGADYDPLSNVIDVYVSMLRKKIDKPFGASLIHTVPGEGYHFGEPTPAAE
jgi:DNA-binding response OmpR family regulator